jgi:magnesium transporter
MGLALGIALGAIGFVRAALTPSSVLGNADRWMLAVVISQSVAAICLWGTLVGSMLPLGFRKLGFDPGYASSPFVATFVDVTGIVIYFSIAKIWLL